MQDAVKLMRVYQRKSKAGKTYFVGFLGQSRVLIMRDDQAEVTGDTLGVWDVFLKEREDQPNRQHQPRAGADHDHDGPIDTRPTSRRASRPGRPKARVRTNPEASASALRGAREINQRLAHVNLNDEMPDLS